MANEHAGDDAHFARAWVADDGRPGHVNQCQMLAHRLAKRVETMAFELSAPWLQLAPRLAVGAQWGVSGPLGERMDGAYPELLVTAGRRGALIARLVKRLSGGRTRTVHILNPGIPTHHFDWVVAPSHDGLSAENVIPTVGALHGIDSNWLTETRERWAPRLGALPKPIVAVLIGGTSRHMKVDADYVEAMAQCAERCLEHGGTLVATTSRRTDDALTDLVRQRFSGLVWTSDADGRNPYSGMLAYADRLVVSGDSISMLSEALGTGSPVFTSARGAGGRLAAFHQQIERAELVRPFSAAPDSYRYQPLREIEQVLARITAAGA